MAAMCDGLSAQSILLSRQKKISGACSKIDERYAGRAI
jgi:hypothetical protein